MSATKTVMVENLDQFVRVLMAWHANKVAMLRHLQSIPEGTEVSKDDGEPLVLTGDMLKGFQMGLEVALEEMGTLPFEAELEDATEAPVAPEAIPTEAAAPAAVH